MLTITEVRCIPTGQATTRLHEAAHLHLASEAPQTATWNNIKDFKSSDLNRRSDQVTEAALADLADSFAGALPADISLLSGGLKDEFTDIASAMFALSVCDSGIDLHAACEALGTISVKYNLLQSWYNPDNVQSTVCFCAQYGYDFDTTRQQLYASLYTALIGVLAASDITTDRGQICDTLSLFNRTGPSLGIDIQEYHDLVCKSIPTPTPTTSIWYGPTPIVPYVSNNITTWGIPTSWLPNTTYFGTGSPATGSANMTIEGTGGATGSANMTIEGTGGATGFPNVTITGTGSPTAVSGNMTIEGTGVSIAGSPNMTIEGTGTPTAWSSNVTISGTGHPFPNWTGNGSTWGPPVSWTGPIGSDWSVTIRPQTNWTDAQPTGTGDRPADTDAFPTDSGVPSWSNSDAPPEADTTDDTFLAARTPRGPNAKQFYPAVPTTTKRSGLFKGY